MSPDGFGAPNAVLPSVDHHSTIWLLLVSLYLGSSEISIDLL
jgi:hypothetical protein